MKRLLAFVLLVTGCSSTQISWTHPDNSVIYCHGTECCYPTSSNTNVCTTSDGLHTVVMYVKVYQK